MQSLGAELQRAGDAAIKGTQSQLASKGEELAIDERRIEAEVRGTQAALIAEETAIALQLTAQAPALALQSTQVEIYRAATQSALEATPLAATAVALAAAGLVHEANVTKQQALSYIIPLGATFLFLAGGVVIFLVGLDLGAWLIERDKMRQARFDSQFGFTVYDYDAGRWILEAPSDKYRSLPAPKPNSQVRFSANKSTAVSSMNARDIDPLVYNFLEKVRDKFGPDVIQLPRWDKLGVTSETWQSAVNVMKVNRIVDPRPREGTYIRDGKTVGDIIYMLDRDELVLTPLPHRRE